MRKFLVLFVVLLVVVFAGCDPRSPQYIEENPVQPGQEYLNGQPPREEPEEPEPLPGGGEVQLTGSPFQEGERLIALTFDDGPSQHTDRILDLLEEHGGAATFFVLGYRVEGRSNTVRRAAQLGSEVAGHSWNHPDFSRLTEEEITWQINAASEAIASIVDQAPRIYRPPYGRTNEAVRKISEQLGYAIINWTLDPRDWEHRDADYIYDHIMSRVQSGDIILLHDIYASTLEAAERVIPRLIEEGYRLVTVTQLLEHLHSEVLPGVVYGRDYDVPMV